MGETRVPVPAAPGQPAREDYAYERHGVANLFPSAGGRNEETLEEARASRAPTGAPDWEIDGWVTSYLAIATGEMDVLSDTVPRLTGHEAQTLEEFLERHPESYAHLVEA